MYKEPYTATTTSQYRVQGNRIKSALTYIGHCSDLYRSRARPIVVRMRTNIDSLADQYRCPMHSTIGPHMVPIVE